MASNGIPRSKPLQASGSLDHFESFDLTPVIGTEFPNVQLTDLIKAENAETLLRDLAIRSKYFQTVARYIMLICISLGAWSCLLSCTKRIDQRHPEGINSKARRSHWKTKVLGASYTSSSQL
jgi:hypothetical protein